MSIENTAFVGFNIDLADGDAGLKVVGPLRALTTRASRIINNAYAIAVRADDPWSGPINSRLRRLIGEGRLRLIGNDNYAETMGDLEIPDFLRGL